MMAIDHENQRASVADVASDLRVLTSLRSRSAVRDRVLPAIDTHLPTEVLGDREGRFAALQELIDHSIAEMVDPAHKAAASELLGSGPLRWQPLTRRGPRAANAFQLGWDAYRRRRESTGASVLDETLAELAAAIDRSGGSAAPLEPVTIVETARTGTTPRTITLPPQLPQRRIGRIAAVVAAVAVLGAAALAVIVRSSGRSERSIPPAFCQEKVHKPGDVAQDASITLRRWSEPFKEAAKALPDSPCAGLIETQSGMVYQKLSGRTDDDLALLLAPTPPGRDVIVLNRLEYERLKLSTWDNDNPMQDLGLPIRRLPDRKDQVRMVQFARGDIVQLTQGDRPFVVTGAFLDFWVAHGSIDGTQLGRPISDRYERPGIGSTQDFLHGRIVTPYEVGMTVSKVVPYSAKDRKLPDDIVGNILVTPADNAFLITPDRKRHWIQHGDERTCVKQRYGAQVIQVPAVAVNQLEVGRVMKCQ